MDAPKTTPPPAGSSSVEDRVRRLEASLGELEAEIRTTLEYTKRFRGLNLLFALGILIVVAVFGILLYSTATKNFSKAAFVSSGEAKIKAFQETLQRKVQFAVTNLNPQYKEQVMGGVQDAWVDLEPQMDEHIKYINTHLQSHSEERFRQAIETVVARGSPEFAKHQAFLKDKGRMEIFQKEVEKRLKASYETLGKIVKEGYQAEIERLKVTLLQFEGKTDDERARFEFEVRNTDEGKIVKNFLHHLAMIIDHYIQNDLLQGQPTEKQPGR